MKRKIYGLEHLIRVFISVEKIGSIMQFVFILNPRD